MLKDVLTLFPSDHHWPISHAQASKKTLSFSQHVPWRQFPRYQILPLPVKPICPLNAHQIINQVLKTSNSKYALLRQQDYQVVHGSSFVSPNRQPEYRDIDWAATRAAGSRSGYMAAGCMVSMPRCVYSCLGAEHRDAGECESRRTSGRRGAGVKGEVRVLTSLDRQSKARSFQAHPRKG
jgi:hypothetical protein